MTHWRLTISFLRAAVALVLGCLMLGCAGGAEDARQPRHEAGPIRVIVGPYLTYAPLFVAQEGGFFEDEGLNVEFVTMPGSPNLVPSLLRGDLDVVPQPISPGWLNAIIRGARIRTVSGKGFWDSDACSVTKILAYEGLFRDGDPASKLVGSEGHRISLNRLLSSRFMVERALASVGMELEQLERVDIPAASEHQGFLNGSLSLSVTSEPWLTRILDTGAARSWMAANEVLPDFQFSYFIFGPGMLDDRPPGDGARFLRAYLRAVRQLGEGKTAENLEILARATKQEEELLRRACWPSFRQDGQLDISGFQDFQQWLFEMQLLDRVMDPAEFWDPRFLEIALEELPPIERDFP